MKNDDYGDQMDSYDQYLQSQILMSTQMATPVVQDIYWSREYVQAAQEIMAQKMDEVYYELFAKDMGYSNRKQSLSRRAFVKNIMGSQFKAAPCPWLFNPQVLRKRFKVVFDDFIKKED